MRMIVHVLIGMAAVLSVPGAVRAAASEDQLRDAIVQMYDQELDDTTALAVSGVSIDQRDMRLLLDSGTISFFKPLVLGRDTLRYGALFSGRGRFQFSVPIAMERQQLRRFFKVDSLHRTFASVILLFDTTTYRQLVRSPGARSASAPWNDPAVLKELQKNLRDSKSRHWFYRTLRSLAEPTGKQFLIVTGPFDKAGILLYMSDPYEREQVGLYSREMRVLYDYIYQPICSYALEADEVTGDYNGVDRPLVQLRHYDIDARIKKSGEMIAATTVHMIAQRRTQILDLDLNMEMRVDSVLDADGRRVAFARYKDQDYYFGLYLLLSRPCRPGDSLTYTFYYSGDVARMELGEYYVSAGATWYPRYGYWQRATFDMRLVSPAFYTLIATGQLVDSVLTRDTLVTRWRLAEPSANASFNIGLFTAYRFAGPGRVPIDIYFSENLHRTIAPTLGSAGIATGRHVERQIADDLEASMKLYDSLFGDYYYDKIVASEILHVASEAFPAFVTLSFFTWLHTDEWGYNRLHRAHEAAHQWWGAGVGFGTYRDQWISEGFAEYSAFLYVQHVAGDKQFADRLNEYRKEILGERKDAAAVALGARSTNVKDKEHFRVVIYHKGAYVLHMLRYLLYDWDKRSDERFIAAMREFYATYRGKDVSTRDFQTVVEKHAGQDLTWFFDQWIYNSAIPTYKCSHKISQEDTSYVVKLRVTQSKVPETFKMALPVEFEYYDGEKDYRSVWINKPTVDYELHFAKRPKKVRFNPFHSVLAEIKQ